MSYAASYENFPQHIQERTNANNKKQNPCPCEFPRSIPPTENNPGICPVFFLDFLLGEVYSGAMKLKDFVLPHNTCKVGPGSSHKWGYGVPINPQK